MKKKGILIIVLICILAAAAAGILLVRSGGDKPAELESTQPGAETMPEHTAEPVEETTLRYTRPYETAYITLEFPLEYHEYLVHSEVVEGDVVSEIFSMSLNGNEYEVFRIVFGDRYWGEYLGVVTAGDVQVPVTYSITSYTADEFVEMGTWNYTSGLETTPLGADALYLALMDGFNPMLEALRDDECFSAETVVETVETAEGSAYWEVQLVDGMDWEQTEESGAYRADFYGTVAGERILLYTIRIGGELNDNCSVIGQFETDGEKRDISIESYPLIPAEGWTDVDMTTAGIMMDTVNNNMQAIIASESFSVPQEVGY